MLIAAKHSQGKDFVMDRSKLVKMFIALTAIIVLASSINRIFRGNSMSVEEYARLHASPTPTGQTPSPDEHPEDSPENSEGPSDESVSPSPDPRNPDSPDITDTVEPGSQLTGAILNASSQLERRYILEEGFYREPLSDSLRRYITGISYPSASDDEAGSQPVITYDQLCYVHILHYDFEGSPTEGELICNETIAQDLLEIFYELYRNEYQLERVLLIDEYDGDDTASMEDNNTSCFNYRVVDDTDNLSRHAYGLAIDVNPLYNPHITYNGDGSENVSPAAAARYSDRSLSFPYKIDENDLCYKLFIQHGFTWGGNWNSSKDYQHFQKPVE